MRNSQGSWLAAASLVLGVAVLPPHASALGWGARLFEQGMDAFVHRGAPHVEDGMTGRMFRQGESSWPTDRQAALPHQRPSQAGCGSYGTRRKSVTPCTPCSTPS